MTSRIDPTKRPPRSQSELQSDSKTLRYELENLVGIAQQFFPQWVDTDPIRNNAYIEAFAVHCRALIFFLYGHLEGITALGKPERFSALRKNDVIAYDFYPSWEKNCPPPSDILVEAKWQADKHVAHITEERREVNQPGSSKQSIWKLGDAASALCTVVAHFLSKAPSENFDSDELVRMKNAISPQPGLNIQGKTSESAAYIIASHSLNSEELVRMRNAISRLPRVNIHGKTGGSGSMIAACDALIMPIEPPRGSIMSTTEPHRTLDELARLGGEIFERQIRPTLRPEDDGKYVAIDVETGDFEIDEDDYAAVARLRSRRPGTNGWLMRAGYPTTYRM